MKRLALCFLFLYVSGALAQDFRCIVPGEDRFYMDGGRMLGLRIIASETVDEGIIHHFNHDLRPVGFNDPSGCNPYSECASSGMDYAYYTLSGASWMGTHMLEAPDGMNVFFNLNGDTIRVSTLAELDESWTVFQWGDGSRLDATVLTIDPEDVQGMVQAVKTIGLQVLDDEGSMIPHPLNDEQWKLSQHNGFTQVHSLYWFPDFPEMEDHQGYQCLSYSEMPDGEHRSTSLMTMSAALPVSEGEMLSMIEVGDEFQYRGTAASGSSSAIYYYLMTITSKTYNGDALDIQFTIETIFMLNGNVQYGTGSVSSSDTAQYFPFGLLPGQIAQTFKRTTMVDAAYLDTYISNADSILAALQETCSVHVVRTQQVDVGGSDISGCGAFHGLENSPEGPRFHLSGFPRPPYFNAWDGGGYDLVPTYVNTAGCQFGEQVLPIGIADMQKQPLTIHPNPASSILRFESPAPTAYTVMDAVGRTVMQGQSQQGQNTLSLDGLRDGMYVLRLEGGSGAGRFVKAGQ